MGSSYIYIKVATTCNARVWFNPAGDAACFSNIDDSLTDTCFSNEAPFVTSQRSVPLPDDPRKDGVFYYLFTKDEEIQTLDARDLSNMTVSWTNIRNRLTTIIIHGMIDAENSSNPNQTMWINEMAEQLLIRDESNVIAVDWSNSSTSPYIQAVSNARVMGALIAQLIRTLKQVVGVQESNIHIIGHGLGAHVAGYVGQRIPGIARISGLDPSSLLFEDTPAEVRLDPSDAIFVDVIHTDIQNYTTSNGIGIKGPVGHMDFYPNLGYRQPGCENETIGDFEYSNCDHRRAYQLFTASINSECGFISFPCNSDVNFESGKCHPCREKGCSPMGYNSVVKKSDTDQLVKYYLRTSDDKPYCLIHLDFILEVRENNTSDSITYPQPFNIIASIKGENRNTTEVPITKEPLYFQPGNIYNFTGDFPDHENKVMAVVLRLVDPYSNETASANNMTAGLDLVHIQISNEPFGLGDARQLCTDDVMMRLNETTIIYKDCGRP